MINASRCQIFIGSSSEGRGVAGALQEELLPLAEVNLWDQGVFKPGGFTLDCLTEQARKSDFAVLVATADDISESRGGTGPAPRDNVILELGLFIGVLGRDRAYLLATSDMRLPSDLLGLTRLNFFEQQNLRSAVSSAARQVRDQVEALGPRPKHPYSAAGGSNGSSPLDAEFAKLAENGRSQGWEIKDSITALRFISPAGNKHTLIKSSPEATRKRLRSFAAELRADGLRVSTSLRRPPSESPFS